MKWSKRTSLLTRLRKGFPRSDNIKSNKNTDSKLNYYYAILKHFSLTFPAARLRAIVNSVLTFNDRSIQQSNEYLCQDENRCVHS